MDLKRSLDFYQQNSRIDRNHKIKSAIKYVGRKKMEENIFIAKLTANNDKMDQAIAKKVAHDLKIFFYVEAFNFAKDEFK